ncbi:MAG TPA: aldo/keto reductase [Myxococcaceae bacterium]|nr:aldo/keto reductase [Myxococcaceae bacterium]
MPSELPAAAAGSMTLGGDLVVRRMGFGAMRITGEGIWGEPKDRAAARAVLRRAVELGVNLIDTADAYGPEVSENIIAEALHPYPAGLVIATKGGLTRSGPNQWQRNGKPEYLRRACEGSLKRLRAERIDVYQLHAVDSAVPLEDSVGELARLRTEGKIRHVALSNVSVEQLQRARKLVPIVSVQNRYNIGDRASEDVLEACEKDGLGFLPWRPVGAGELSRAGGALDRVAKAHEVTPAQVVLAWLLLHSPVMLPIPGTSSVAHLEENVAAAALSLDDAEMLALERG